MRIALVVTMIAVSVAAGAGFACMVKMLIVAATVFVTIAITPESKKDSIACIHFASILTHSFLGLTQPDISPADRKQKIFILGACL